MDHASAASPLSVAYRWTRTPWRFVGSRIGWSRHARARSFEHAHEIVDSAEATATPRGEAWQRITGRHIAWLPQQLRLRSQRNEDATREITKKAPIFLPFRKSAAVKSAASEKMDDIIEAKELQIERKHFYVEFRENERGKFLRITEEAHGRRNTIIVPSTGVDEFTAAISEVLTNNGTAPL